MKLLTLLLLCLLSSCVHTGGTPRPNVLLIMLDDFGYNDLAINNGSDSPTPILDQLAQIGMRYTRHYTESSCSPSRAALLTGRYPASLGYHPTRAGISSEVVTLPEVLRDAGYETHMIGKWHIGEKYRGARPEGQGFDDWFGFTNQLYLAGPHDDTGYKRAWPRYRNPWLETEHDAPREFPGHLTDILTERALDVVKSATKPWFLYLAYYAPHAPIQPGDSFAKQFPDTKAGRYQALKAQLDHNIGLLYSTLKERGQLDNTMIVVVSDNGGTSKEYPSNLPFPGGKVSYQEGGTRTPLILSWPNSWRNGVVVEETAAIFDIFPTITAALNLATPAEVDGIDLLHNKRTEPLFWYSHYDAAMDSSAMLSAGGDWLYSLWVSTFTILQKSSPALVGNPENLGSEQSERVGAMASSSRIWSRGVTDVELTPETLSDGRIAYSGDEFRRTPISGSWSLGMSIALPKIAPIAPLRLAAQAGYLDLTVVPGGELEIRFDNHQFSVQLPKTNNCFSLVLTAKMTKTNQIFYKIDSPSTAKLYVDGNLSSEQNYVSPHLNDAPPETPLIMNGESAAALPIISTRVIDDNEIADSWHPELIAACESLQPLAQ
ncbi:MAG: arylsulfatase A-like enzyme [Halieaceae bacterium]|jgi:arylsulfatase A-like enzyme